MKKLLLLMLLLPAIGANAQWTTHGPNGGEIISVAITYGLSPTMFAGTAHNGLFVSTNNGVTWSQANNGLTDHQVSALLINGENVFAGTEAGGVFISSNYGSSWSAINNGLPAGCGVYSLAVTGTLLYAGTNYGVYVSGDNGQSWTAATNGLGTAEVYQLVTCQGAVFVLNYEGVFESFDTGATWNAVTGAPGYCNSLVNIGPNIYAGSANDGIYISEDTGDTWTPLDSGLAQPDFFSYPSSVLLGANEDHLFAAVEELLSDDSFYIYTPGGDWQVSGNLSASIINCAAGNGSTIIAGTNNGLYVSYNWGATWQLVGLDITQITSLYANGTTIMASSGSPYISNVGSINISFNNGLNWNGTPGLSAEPSALLNIGTKFFAAAGVYLYQSADSGLTWTENDTAFGQGQVLGFAAVGSVIFAATTNGLFKSDDSGSHWTLSDSGFISTYNPMAVSGSYIYASSTSAIFVSTDTGNHWTMILDQGASSLAASGSTIYAAINSGANIYFSSNYGATWVEADRGIIGQVEQVAVSDSGVFACTATSGVFFSSDSGAYWVPVNTGLGTLVVISLGTNSTTVFAGTGSAGVWQRPLSQIVGCNPPAAPVAQSQQVCTEMAVTLTAAGTGTISWYSDSVGGNYIQSGNTYVTPVLDSTLVVYVQDSTCGPSLRTAVVVTVGALAVPVNTTPAGNDTICAGNKAALSVSGSGTITWYSAASGGTLLATGANFLSPVLNTGAIYYAQDSNSCGASARVAITVSVISPPVVQVSATPDTICGGTTSTLLAAATGGTISWYSAASGGVYLSGADSFTTPVLDTTTTYYAQDSNSCGVSARVGSTISVISPLLVQVSAAPDTICSGSTATLIAEGSGGIISWYSAASGGVYLSGADSFTTHMLDNTTTYYAQDSNSCGASGRVAITVSVISPPVVQVSATPDTICGGTTSTLLAAATGGTISWYSAASGGAYLSGSDMYTTSVLYTSTTYYAQDSSSCAVQRLPVTVYVKTGSIPIINQPSPDSLGTTVFVSYQWLLNDSAVAGATSQGFVATQSGSYRVVVVNASGCMDTSAPINIFITGLPQSIDASRINLYPNPASGTCQLTVGSELIGSKLEMYDAEGRLVFQSAIQSLNSKIPVFGLASGVYLLQISNAQGSVVRKLVKM